MIPVVFLSHSEQQCGVHQFGKQIFEALRASTTFQFNYCEVGDASELLSIVEKINPRVILLNFHQLTIGWADGWPLWSLGIPVIGIMHEMTDTIADHTDDTQFDSYIFHDPTAKFSNPLFFKAGRLIRPLTTELPPPPRVTIGSFGFATPGKNFEGLVARAHAEFDDCLIRLNIPFSSFCDMDGSQARLVAARCQSIISKPGVDIEISHDFMDLDQVVTFLAANSLNAFFYDTQDDRGISSAIDLALAARRPIALRRGALMRHLFDAQPSIFVDERSLREIMESGTTPLLPYLDAWTGKNIRADYEAILEKVLSRWHGTSLDCRLRRIAKFAERARASEELLRETTEREASAKQAAAMATARAETAERAAAAATARAETAERAAAAAAARAVTANVRAEQMEAAREAADAAAARTQQELANRDARLVGELRSDLEKESRALKLGLGTARAIRVGAELLKRRRKEQGPK
jgi:hypothetical protein